MAEAAPAVGMAVVQAAAARPDRVGEARATVAVDAAVAAKTAQTSRSWRDTHAGRQSG